MAPLSIFGDFDQDGRISRRASEQDLRAVFPGLILLPNIDADRRRKLPRGVRPAKSVPLDHKAARSGADDEGAQIIVQVSNAAARHLNFEISDGQAPFLAMIDGKRRLVSRKGDAFRADIAGPGDHRFQIESITTRGSPMIGLAAQAPSFMVTAIAFDSDGMELERDKILATVAPWLIHDNLSPPSRLYICEIDEDAPIDRGNKPSVKEVREIARSLRGIVLVKIPDEVNNGDAWIQDQYQLGYCEAPRRHLDVIAHLPRLRSNVSDNSLSANLSTMVGSHFPSANLGVFKDFYDRKLGTARSKKGTRTILYKDSFELSRLMDRMWNTWAMARQFYFKSDITKTVRDRSLERDFQLNNLMEYYEARSKLRSAVNRTRRVLDKRADRAVKEGQKELLQQQRAVLSKQMSLVHKTVILRARTREISITTRSFGPLIFSQQQINDFDANMIFKHDSMNFGGNLEVSPPLKDAPLGKIAFGANLSNKTRSADPDVVAFLQGQSAQPVVDIDTAWLDVAHVDEIMAFVPAPSLAAKAAIAVASPSLAMAILDAAMMTYLEGSGGAGAVTAGVDPFRPHPALRDRTMEGDAPITQMLRGRYWLHHIPPDAFTTIAPPTIYLDMARHYPVNFHLLQDGSEVIALNHEPGQDRYYNASLSIREFRYFGRYTNDWLAENQFAKLRDDLKKNFRGLEQILIPVLYDEVNWVENEDKTDFEPDFTAEQTSAFLPNGVNMQILGEHVMVPRPYGPRAAPEVAAKILKTAFPKQAGLFTADRFIRQGLDKTIHWIKPPIYPGASGSDLGRIANQFKDGFPDLEEGEIQEIILKANKQSFGGRNPADHLPDLLDGWQRILIPEGRVDLFEACIHAQLSHIGLKVHFVDSWYYHIRFGEIHCGTNVLRRRKKTAPKWWTPEAI